MYFIAQVFLSQKLLTYKSVTQRNYYQVFLIQNRKLIPLEVYQFRVKGGSLIDYAQKLVRLSFFVH